MPSPPAPGPTDRISFFDAQVRNRRSARWLARLSVFTVILMGLPLSAVLTPILLGFLMGRRPDELRAVASVVVE